MPGNRTTLCAVLVAAWSSTVAITSPAWAQQEFYRGKTLSVVVGLAPGGGIDIIARLFSRILAKHIDGAPTVIVRNMPGAAGATAMNYMVQRAPKDGTTLIYDSWTPLEQVIKARHVTYDYTKMELVGALRSGPFMMFARSDILPGGIASSADFVRAPAIVYGGQQPALQEIEDIEHRNRNDQPSCPLLPTEPVPPGDRTPHQSLPPRCSATESKSLSPRPERLTTIR